MKKRVYLMLISLLLCLCVTNVQAFWIGDVTAPTEGVTATNVMGFDWSSSGSAMAIPLPEGQPIAVGQTFTLNYQAELVGLTDSLGDPVVFPGLTTDFEFTLVATIPEIVTAVVGPIALFTTLPGSQFYLYYDDVPNTNVASGFGFDDGALVASGSFLPGQLSSYLATSLEEGIGSYILEGLVDFVDSTYLDPSLLIFDFRSEGTINRPALDSTTLSFFDGVAGEGYLDTVLTEDWLQFKADASSKFSVIPEPGTILLLGAGLLGLAFTMRRRNKN